MVQHPEPCAGMEPAVEQEVELCGWKVLDTGEGHPAERTLTKNTTAWPLCDKNYPVVRHEYVAECVVGLVVYSVSRPSHLTLYSVQIMGEIRMTTHHPLSDHHHHHSQRHHGGECHLANLEGIHHCMH